MSEFEWNQLKIKTTFNYQLCTDMWFFLFFNKKAFYFKKKKCNIFGLSDFRGKYLK